MRYLRYQQWKLPVIVGLLAFTASLGFGWFREHQFQSLSFEQSHRSVIVPLGDGGSSSYSMPISVADNNVVQAASAVATSLIADHKPVEAAQFINLISNASQQEASIKSLFDKRRKSLPSEDSIKENADYSKGEESKRLERLKEAEAITKELDSFARNLTDPNSKLRGQIELLQTRMKYEDVSFEPSKATIIGNVRELIQKEKTWPHSIAVSFSLAFSLSAAALASVLRTGFDKFKDVIGMAVANSIAARVGVGEKKSEPYPEVKSNSFLA